MKSTNCVVSNCLYLLKINKRSGNYRCLHPDADKDKKSRRDVLGMGLSFLRECPKHKV